MQTAGELYKSRKEGGVQFYNKSFDECLGFLGGFGKYQWFVAACFVLGHLTGPMINNGLTFLTAMPKGFEC